MLSIKSDAKRSRFLSFSAEPLRAAFPSLKGQIGLTVLKLHVSINMLMTNSSVGTALYAILCGRSVSHYQRQLSDDSQLCDQPNAEGYQ